MSTLQVANITGIASINAVSYQSNGATVLTGNTTVTQLQVNSANALVANSTSTLLTVGGTTTLTANTTGITSAGIVADSVATIRPLVNMTVANTATSNTYYDFIGIPSWVKRITVMLSGVSTSGTSGLIIQLGTAGGITTSGYLGSATAISGGTPGTYSITTGLALDANGAGMLTASSVRHGQMIISNLSGNIWVSNFTTGFSDATNSSYGGSSISLAGALTQLRLTTVNGANTFDAGSVNVMYE